MWVVGGGQLLKVLQNKYQTWLASLPFCGRGAAVTLRPPGARLLGRRSRKMSNLMSNVHNERYWDR